MAKTSGLGDNFYAGGYDLSGDTAALGGVTGGIATIDVTGIDKSAIERIGGLRSGSIEWTSHFNTATSHSHPVLSALPTADVHVMYARGTTLGNASACLVAKQINYDPTRGTDGALTFAVDAQANAYGLEWGQLLTAGLRTDTSATNGSSIDTAASASFGWQAYLQVTAFSGTDVTIKIQDSADDSSYSDLSGAAFTAVTAAPFTQRLASSGATDTVRRYLRAVTTTSGGVTSVKFAVMVVKNAAVSVVF